MTHIPWGHRSPGTCPALAEQDQMGQGFILLQFGGWHEDTSSPCERPLLKASGRASVCKVVAAGHS